MLDRIFNRWTKWEIVEMNVTMVHTKYYYGVEIYAYDYLVDRYKRTNKYTGLVEYKDIRKS